MSSETFHTEVAYMRQAHTLGNPAEPYDALIRNFDDGNTWTRDAGLLSTSARSTILTIAEAGRTRLTPAEHELFKGGQQGLADALSPTEHTRELFVDDVAEVLLSEAVIALDAGHLHARRFNACFKEYGGVMGLLSRPERALPILQAATRNPRYAYNIGHYAAGRSLQGELDQQRRYGPLLSEAKTLGRSQLDVLGPKMGLRWEHIHRAKAQIDRVAFGAADLLFKGGTGGTILGDYHSGTLRVEMNEEVDAAILGKAMTAHHEVAHAGSAQSHPDARSGLSVGNRGNHMGLNANEAIATFVSEEAYGLPHITRLGDDSIQVSVNGIYTAPTVAAASLYFRQPGDFAALYRAHYGQVDDQRHLAHVLTGFDTEVHRINQYLAPRR